MDHRLEFVGGFTWFVVAIEFVVVSAVVVVIDSWLLLSSCMPLCLLCYRVRDCTMFVVVTMLLAFTEFMVLQSSCLLLYS